MVSRFHCLAIRIVCVLIPLTAVLLPAIASAEEPLTVEILKLYQKSKSHAAIDVRFINTSSKDLKHWSVVFEAYDSGGDYIGKSSGMVSYIRAGDEKIESILFLNTQAPTINKISAKLDAVVGKSGQREDFGYVLKIKK